MDYGSVLGMIVVHSVLLVLLVQICSKKARARNKASRWDSQVPSTDSTSTRSQSQTSRSGVSYGKATKPKEPVVTKIALRDLGDEPSLSRSKLQGSSEFLDEEDTTTAVGSLARVTTAKTHEKKEGSGLETQDSSRDTLKQFADEYTAQEASLRVEETPPMGSSSCATLEHEHGPATRPHTPTERERVPSTRPHSPVPRKTTVESDTMDHTPPTASAKLQVSGTRSADPSEIGADPTKEVAPKSSGPSDMGPDAVS
ncbi:hypothetical protein GCK32_018553 [Trichostrongylus colubriformis]|uniref:Uncharacterized protein n=1 Tax=Trichostrongylus colubriformis TaxID=6319 RepID=A0AAN8F0B7_TRICO